jgi:MerR family copper efflux transcriptional regulator
MNFHVRVFTIGELAKETATTTPTIRYYEEIRLLPPASRKPGGQRIYDESTLSLLTFIRRCRDFGFSIDEVRVLVELSRSGSQDCVKARDVAQVHLDAVRKKVIELKALEQSLVNFVAECNDVCAGGPGRDCVIFKELAIPSQDRKCCG